MSKIELWFLIVFFPPFARSTFFRQNDFPDFPFFPSVFSLPAPFSRQYLSGPFLAFPWADPTQPPVLPVPSPPQPTPGEGGPAQSEKKARGGDGTPDHPPSKMEGGPTPPCSQIQGETNFGAQKFSSALRANSGKCAWVGLFWAKRA